MTAQLACAPSVYLVLTALLAAAGCGSDDSNDEPVATSTTSSVATTGDGPDPLVGEWATDNECEKLVDTLTEAGLEEYVTKMARGATDLPPGEIDPSDPCKGAEPVQHSHSFSETGEFASLDENGRQVDFGAYDVTGEGVFILHRPPFQSEVHYQVSGDTATFDVVVPNCDTNDCRTAAALGIATFFPHIYERVVR
jgi:hypothetical protein